MCTAYISLSESALRQIHYISNALNNNIRVHFINTKVNILPVSKKYHGFKMQRIDGEQQPTMKNVC